MTYYRKGILWKLLFFFDYVILVLVGNKPAVSTILLKHVHYSNLNLIIVINLLVHWQIPKMTSFQNDKILNIGNKSIMKRTIYWPLTRTVYCYEKKWIRKSINSPSILSSLFFSSLYFWFLSPMNYK